MDDNRTPITIHEIVARLQSLETDIAELKKHHNERLNYEKKLIETTFGPAISSAGVAI